MPVPKPRLNCSIFQEVKHSSIKSANHEIILIYFSSIVKQAFCCLCKHARVHPWNQSVLCDEDKVSCSTKQREPLIGSLRLAGIHRLGFTNDSKKQQ